MMCFLLKLCIFFERGLIVFSLLGLASRSLAQGDMWEEKTNMPTPRLGLATSVVNGKIYAIGGYPAANIAGMAHAPQKTFQKA